MTERRYDEAEVAAIFKRAAEAQQTRQRQLSSPGEGMTLAELQEIGREVGIAPETVAEVALSMDRVGKPTSRRFLGLPIGVGRTIDLGRKLSDDEWERFVVQLRETFDARGNLKSEGSFRQWTNGNLQALLEPTETGHRIRLRTFKGGAAGMMTMGLTGVGISLVSALVTGGAAVPDVAMYGILGAVMFLAGAVRLPGWARTRRRQMEEIASRIVGVSAPRMLDVGEE